MNLYILVDIEGISGVYSPSQAYSDGNRTEEARELMTKDVNACVDAAKEAGVDKIYVRDCHGQATLLYTKSFRRMRISAFADIWESHVLPVQRTAMP